MSDNDESVKVVTVQHVLWWKEKLVSELYVRVIDGHAEVFAGELRIDKASKLSFNTYYNSFYSAYWNECTSVEGLQLRLKYKGNILVEIYTDTPHLGCVLVHKQRLVSENGVVSGLVDIPSFNKPIEGLGGRSMRSKGRVFFDVLADKETDSVVYAAEYVVSSAPLRTPRLTLGICTFNREAYLYNNLKELADTAFDGGLIKEVIIVNQGEAFELKPLKELVDETDAITLISQPNLGGCGGFTRTMLESLQREGITHHVLMDDDAHLDVRVLDNLGHFLAHTDSDIVVGGHMLDLFRPWTLYEAGSKVKPSSRIEPLHHGIDLRKMDSLTPFLKFHTSDYNAWWFCAIPIEWVKVAQFPAPIFIRGDDVEYGVRLQELGVRTVAMPGIAVWHEPFYAKTGGWQVYYDYRNRMILASSYRHRFELESPVMLAWGMFNALSLHNYQEAALICEATEDFLSGPSLIRQDVQVVHARVVRAAKQHAPTVVDTLDGLRKIPSRKKINMDVVLAMLIIYRIFRVLVGRSSKPTAGVWGYDRDIHLRTIGAFAYVKTNGDQTYRYKYSPDRRALKALTNRCLRVLIDYISNRKRVAVQWSSELDGSKSSEYWKNLFEAAAGSEAREFPLA